MQKYVIAQDGMYNAWPDVAMTESGALLCVFTECAHHLDRKNSAIVISRSTDGGKTWGAKERISAISADGKEHFNNARIQRLGSGEMAILCDRLPSFDGDLRSAQTFIWHGGKEGKEWSEPTALDVWGIVPDKMLETQSGKRIIAAHHQDEHTGKVAQYCYISEDERKTWTKRTIASDIRYDLCEASLIEVEKDVIVALMRENSGMGYDCMKAISYDGGWTWNGVYAMPIPGGHRPGGGILKDGSVAITCRFMHGGRGGFGHIFHSVFFVLTDKESLLATHRNKQSVRIFPFDYDRSSHADTGYTGWVQLDEENIYAVNYIVDDWPRAQIRGYRIHRSDIIL